MLDKISLLRLSVCLTTFRTAWSSSMNSDSSRHASDESTIYSNRQDRSLLSASDQPSQPASENEDIERGAFSSSPPGDKVLSELSNPPAELVAMLPGTGSSEGGSQLVQHCVNEIAGMKTPQNKQHVIDWKSSRIREKELYTVHATRKQNVV